MTFYHHLANCDVSYVGRSRADCLEILGHHVFQYVYYAHVDEAYAIDLFNYLRVAQRIMLCFCEPRNASHN